MFHQISLRARTAWATPCIQGLLSKVGQDSTKGAVALKGWKAAGLSGGLCGHYVRPVCTSSPTEAARQRNADGNAVAVVVGASRGIGLAIVQSLVRRWKGKIVATCRDVENAGALNALWQFMPDRMAILPLDVCDEDSVSC